MKIKRILSATLAAAMLLCCCALTACASKPAVPTATDFEVQPGAYRYQDMGDCFVETEQGQYYLGWDQIIRFAEPGSRSFYPLCNKPNCGHGGENCNAYTDYGLGYWNGHLYTTTYGDNGPVVMRMDMDGANHREVGQLPVLTAVDGARHGSGELLFHNGSLFYMYDAIETDPEWAMSIYQFDLETGKGRWLFQEDIPPFTYFCGSSYANICGDGFFFMMTNGVTGECTYALGNLKTGRVEATLPDWSDRNGRTMEQDGVLYYFKADAGLCEYDRATGVETVRFPMEAYTANPCYTRNYILVRSTDTEDFEQCTLWVLDRDYNLLGKAPQEKIGRWFPQPYAITADSIYFWLNGKITHYIDTSDLSNLELLPMPDTSSARVHG